MSIASGHKAVLLEGEELAKQMNDFTAFKDGLVRLTPGRWIYPVAFMKYADNIYNFKFKPSDVVLMSYPKCGSHWLQEIIWTMRNIPDFNHPLAGFNSLAFCPFLDYYTDLAVISTDFLDEPFVTKESMKNRPLLKNFRRWCPGKDPANGVSLQIAQAILDPRTIKVHLPFSFISPSTLDTAKVVYVARNPKDVVVSFHHYCRLNYILGYEGSLEDFVQYFVDDNLVYGPYWLHVKEAWEKRHHPNLHFIFYEDLKTDIMGELKKLNTFLDTKLTEVQLKNIATYTSFGEMKARAIRYRGKDEDVENFNREVAKKDGGFFRKGAVGDWKNKLTPDLEAKMEKWINDNMNFGISFKYS